jgi:hypothetical protein
VHRDACSAFDAPGAGNCQGQNGCYLGDLIGLRERQRRLPLVGGLPDQFSMPYSSCCKAPGVAVGVDTFVSVFQSPGATCN